MCSSSGVEFAEVSSETVFAEEVLAGFKEKAQPFYEMGADFGWSDGLYDTVKKAMGAE